MKKSIKYLLCASFLSIGLNAQKIQVANADKEYDKYAYVDAIKTYEKVFERGYKSPDLLKKLGNAYYYQADLVKAEKWYSELFATPQSIEPEYYYRYAQSLKAVKNYVKADEILAQFYKMNNNDLRAQLAKSQQDYLEVIKRNSGRYEIENAGINSPQSDYGSAYFDGKVIFATARDTGSLSNRRHHWNGQSFTNLYSAEMGDAGTLANPSKFSKVLNTKFHESTPIFTKDGKTVYFTRNNYLDGKKGKDSKRTTLLKLYKATINENNDWTDVKELPFNSDEYSVAHPALSPDEKTLYFASDMPGTLGQSDLWKVALQGEDSYGTPENLGKNINTEGRETFPFITSDNELYFASEGHPGLGGLDVFTAKAAGNGTFDKVQNVGEPINSTKDDFAFIMDAQSRYGYVTSNREGGNGSDDIYKFKETKRIPELCEQSLSGVVTDENTGLPIPLAKVILYDANYKYLRETTSDAKGNYDFGKVDCGSKFIVKAEKEGYDSPEVTVNIPNVSGHTDAPIKPKDPKAIKPVGVGDDVAKALGIDMIYFDLDKSYIRPDAAVELSKILYVMEQYPTMEIDVRSHTDCRQTAAYNMALSDRRAKSTIAWLVQHGIAPSRLTGRGYGESQLVTPCPCEPTNQSSCSEEQHQRNRRSEFIITKK
jgi:outer membrane protein OmpA-like peptidoglycan-associated protein/tetratricopeptide (TPR) repeat protein